MFARRAACLYWPRSAAAAALVWWLVEYWNDNWSSVHSIFSWPPALTMCVFFLTLLLCEFELEFLFVQYSKQGKCSIKWDWVITEIICFIQLLSLFAVRCYASTALAVMRFPSVCLCYWVFFVTHGPLTSTWLHLRCGAGLEEGEY